MDKNTIIKRSSIVFSKYGIKCIGVDEVSRILGISKKTLYENIENKNKLIQNVVQTNLENFYFKITKVLAQEQEIFRKLCGIYQVTIEEVQKVNPAYIYDLKKYHTKQYKKIIEFRDNKLYELVAQSLYEGIHKGIFRNDINTKYVFFNQVHKISILVFDSVFESREPLTSQVVYQLILNDIRGITTLEGHEMFDQDYPSLLKLKMTYNSTEIK